MIRSRIARRYARALFDLAIERNLLKAIEDDLAILKREYETVKEFRNFIASPVVAREIKQQTFSALYKKRLHTLTFNFVMLLFSKNREEQLADIVAEFHDLLDEHRGIVRGKISTVVPLSAAQLKAVKAHLDRITGKDVVLTQELDENLLGGFVVKVKDKVFDASLRHQLVALRASFVRN